MRKPPALFLFSIISFLFFTAATPIPISPADSPPPAHPPLGINLEPALDFAHSMMFVDLIKSARKFGSADKPWLGDVLTDENGWPTTDAGIVVAADTPLPPGDYAFSCTGRCTLDTPASKASVKNQSWNPNTKTTTATVTVDENTDSLFLSFKSTDGGVKNIRLLRPGYPLKSNPATDTFSKDFLNALAPFSTLRTMDLTRTNGSEIKEWADRAKPTDALQSSAKGVAWEYAILLANQSHKDLWINIPLLASDDYIRQLATLLKSTLDKDRVVYVEYSNEIWNGMFPQFRQNLDAAKAEVAAGNSPLNDNGNDKNEYYWAWKRTAKRLVEISNIFKQVYGVSGPAPINATIRPVLASQSANPFIARLQLDFIEKTYGPPNKFIYALAGAPYLALDSKISNRDDLTADELFKTLLPNSLDTARQWINDYQLIARYYRLHSLCYEGGPALEGEHSAPVKIAANRDDRMTPLLTSYLTTWYSSGGELFMYYNLASSYTKWGCWGLTEDIRKSAPKLKALTQIAAAPTPPVTLGAPVPGNLHLQPDTADYLLLITSAGNYTLTLDPAPTQDLDLLLSSQPLPTLTAKSPTLQLHLDKGQLVLHPKSPLLSSQTLKLEKQ